MIRLTLAPALLLSCVDGATAPEKDFRIEDPSFLADSVLEGPPGGTPGLLIQLRAVDVDGVPVSDARVRWATLNAGASVRPGSAFTDDGGFLSGRWILGRQAAERQRLIITVTGRGGLTRSFSLEATARPVTVASFTVDSIATKLGVRANARVTARDFFGNRFSPDSVSFRSGDSSLFTVDSLGVIDPRRRGAGVLLVTVGAAPDTVPVTVFQVVRAIDAEIDTLRFSAIGVKQSFAVRLIDDQGLALADSAPSLSTSDTAVASVVPGPDFTFMSRGNGTTRLVFSVGGVTSGVWVVVTQVVASVEVSGDAATLDALGDTTQLTAGARDSAGAPMAASIVWRSSDSTTASVSAGGLVTARRNGLALAIATAANGVADTVAIVVAQVPASRVLSRDSVEFSALGAEARVGLAVLDRLGSVIEGVAARFRSGDTAVVRVTTDGLLRAVGNGSATVWAEAAGDSVAMPLRVKQRPVRLELVPDSLLLDAIDAWLRIAGTAFDSLGSSVEGTVQSVVVADTAIAVARGDTLRARANGVSSADVTIAGFTARASVRVRQRVAVLAITRMDSASIVMRSLGEMLPLRCVGRDRNGYEIAGLTVDVTSRRTSPAQRPCDQLTATSSGVDTLQARAEGAQAEIEITVAVRPLLDTPKWRRVSVDSFPAGAGQWAPSAHSPSAGVVDAYFASYVRDSVTGVTHSDLHRARSIDAGSAFEYQGVALAHDTLDCEADGQGIENVVITERPDGIGFRMFYSSGSYCLGWKIRSAVSSDQKSWLKEPGIRIGDPTGTPAFSAGEGMSILKATNGDWLLFAGVFAPGEGFGIEIWRSLDQIKWVRERQVYSPRSNPIGLLRAIYSPSVVKIGPSLWRLVYCADDVDQSGGRSRLYSSVSRDLINWSFEGELLGEPATHFWYTALVGTSLFFVTQPVGREGDFAPVLSQASIRQP